MNQEAFSKRGTMHFLYKILIFTVLSLFLHATESLDHFLIQCGYDLTPQGTADVEGYVTPKQREAFIKDLQGLPWVKKIAEVGFNAGHTSELFLEFVASSEVVAFDINSHFYTNSGVEFIRNKYKDRFSFIDGDSLLTVVDFSKAHPNEKFDLIYIDGGHTLDVCLNDILNFKKLAHKDSIVWIDDVNFSDVRKAVEIAERLRLIKVLKSEVAEDEFGTRAWVVCRYLISS